MSSWDLLDERSETELHKARLLNVEEKPFKRITKRIATVSSLISKLPHNEGPSDGIARSTQQLQEDLILDFAAFDSSIARLQFLHDANARERARYDDDKQRIVDECQAVRERNGHLRDQLEGARATLAQRKKFDELADKITSNRLLRPREDQLANLGKLEDECRELERESETYTETWRERRDQFNRIMEEGMLLRRQIRDEKEEVDRREGMNEGTEDDGAPAPTPRPEMQGSATPRPDGGDGPQKEEGEDGGAATPAGDHLQVPGVSNGRTSKDASAAGSAAPTPKPEQEEIDREDDNGDEDGEVSGDDMDTDEAHEPGTPQEAEAEKMEVDD